MNFLALGILIATAHQGVPDEIGTRDGDEARDAARPIDFAEVERKIARLPELGARPRFGLFLFGLNGEIRIWAVLDKSTPEARTHNVLYFDLDGDGDLTDANERFVGKVATSGRPSATFEIGRFAVPGTEDVHEDFTLTSRQRSVSFEMKWRGEKTTMGAYGPDSDTYGDFTSSIEKATIFVPGYDRPFTFDRWYGGKLPAGGVTEFKVFIGNRGDRSGAFTCVDSSFLPPEEFPVATLIYHDGSGKERRQMVKLTERC